MKIRRTLDLLGRNACNTGGTNRSQGDGSIMWGINVVIANPTEKARTMADTIKVISSVPDPHGSDAITIRVEYDGKNATILLKPGMLGSIYLRQELYLLGRVLQETPISHLD